MGAFEEAREQINAALSASPGEASLVVQLGDLGSGASSGSARCFAAARDYLSRFTAPFTLITGNHDLEGPEFDDDGANLAAWEAAFGQRHFWARDVGPALLVGLSTTRYRSNVMSHHEVHVSGEQLAWLERVLERVAPGKPVVIFTHAPPMGCGLKVINDLHIKNRCAWLNHSGNAHVFMDIVARHPRIKLWFSGHFHLSHNYADSVVATAGCVFVQTGVIGPHCNRDGFRQSRLLRVGRDGYQVLTVDHEEGGTLRLDVEAAWDAAEPPAVRIPDDEVICDPYAGYVCAQDTCSVLWHDAIQWFTVGPDTLLAHQDGSLIEYDARTFAPTGCVTLDTEGLRVVLRDADGTDVTAAVPGDGSCVAAVQLVEAGGAVRRSFARNAWGSFFTVFQPNKWQLKRRQLAARHPPSPASETISA